MSENNSRPVPEFLNDKKAWYWSRRRFFKNVVLAGLAAQTSFIQACFDKNTFHPLTNNQYKILVAIQDILFPTDEYGPGAAEFNADKYIIWMLNDKRMDQEENQFLVNGIDWLEEESEKKDNISFLERTRIDQEVFIKHILTLEWGESWLSVNLTYIIEAMVSDPIYGFNTEKKGWEWLNHYAGLPRPELHTMYDAIFNTVKSRGV